MSKKKKIPDLKRWLIPQLRRTSFKWPARSEAMKQARVARGQYECNICKGIFRNKEIQMDHINPVVDIKQGWQDWDTFINSLFCDVSGWQILCKKCHEKKTNKENKKRNRKKT